MQYAVDYKRIQKMMIDKDIKTVNCLSQKSGISRNSLGRILKGSSQPSAKIMYALVDTLSIPPKDAGEIFFGYKLTQ